MLLLQLCRTPCTSHVGQESEFSLALRSQPFNFPFLFPHLKQSRDCLWSPVAWLNHRAELPSRAAFLSGPGGWAPGAADARPAMPWAALLPSPAPRPRNASRQCSTAAGRCSKRWNQDWLSGQKLPGQLPELYGTTESTPVYGLLHKVAWKLLLQF